MTPTSSAEDLYDEVALGLLPLLELLVDEQTDKEDTNAVVRS